MNLPKIVLLLYQIKKTIIMSIQYNPNFYTYVCMKKLEKKYTKMLEVLLVCINGAFYSLYLLIVTNFFQKAGIMLIVTRRLMQFYLLLQPCCHLFPILILHIIHFIFTPNSKVICWSEQDWAEVLFPYLSPFLLGFLGCHITKTWHHPF